MLCYGVHLTLLETSKLFFPILYPPSNICDFQFCTSSSAFIVVGLMNFSLSYVCEKLKILFNLELK